MFINSMFTSWSHCSQTARKLEGQILAITWQEQAQPCSLQTWVLELHADDLTKIPLVTGGFHALVGGWKAGLLISGMLWEEPGACCPREGVCQLRCVVQPFLLVVHSASHRGSYIWHNRFKGVLLKRKVVWWMCFVFSFSCYRASGKHLNHNCSSVANMSPVSPIPLHMVPSLKKCVCQLCSCGYV